MRRAASSERWCGRGAHGAGPGTGRAAGAGSAGPGPGSHTRAPCPSEAGEEQRRVRGRGDTRDAARRELTRSWVCSRCRVATSLPGTRLPSPAPSPNLLCSPPGPKRGVPPVSPWLASSPPCAHPWWPWHRVWVPLASWGWLGAGPHGGAGCCRDAPVLVGAGLPQASAHWDRGLCPKHFVRRRSCPAGSASSPEGLFIPTTLIPPPE